MVTKIINGITSTINISESTESLDDLPVFAGTVKSTDDRLLEIVGNDNVDITLIDVESLLGSNVFYIRQESDFPVQDNTTITLDTGTYLISASIQLTKRFVITDGASIEISSTCEPVNSLFYPQDGTLFTGAPRFLFLKNIFIIGSESISVFDSDATLFDLELTVPNRGTLALISCSISIFKDYGTLTNITTVLANTLDLAAFGAGLKFVNVAETNLNLVRITNGDSTTGISSNDAAIKLISGNFQVFVFNNGSFRPLTGESFFFIDPSITINSGVISNNAFDIDNGGTFFFTGSIDETNVNLRVFGNGVQKDSATVGEFAFNNNATATVISGIDTPVIIAGAGVAGNLERFMFASNRLTYIGREDVTPIIRARASTSVAASNEGDSYTLYIYKNGGPLTEVTNTQALNGINSKVEFNIQLLETLSANDYLEIFIENNTTTENITLTSAQLIVG